MVGIFVNPLESDFLPACLGCEFTLENVLFVARECLPVQDTIIRDFGDDGDSITAHV